MLPFSIRSFIQDPQEASLFHPDSKNKETKPTVRTPYLPDILFCAIVTSESSCLSKRVFISIPAIAQNSTNNHINPTLSWMRQRQKDVKGSSKDVMNFDKKGRSSSDTCLSLNFKRNVLVGTGIFVLLVLLEGARNSSPTATTSSSTTTQGDLVHASDPYGIVAGTVEGNESVPYYSCGRGGVGDDNTHIDLILLHGAAFTKENWKESGILQQFCNIPWLRVVALDIQNQSKEEDLLSAITGMRLSQMISPNKKVALVTPSASGTSMVNWADHDAESMLEIVDFWIPVACSAVIKAETAVLKRMDPLKILAVYGSKDTRLIPASTMLEKYANAKVVEIEGRHQCYLDSPDDFVHSVVNFLKGQ